MNLYSTTVNLKRKSYDNKKQNISKKKSFIFKHHNPEPLTKIIPTQNPNPRNQIKVFPFHKKPHKRPTLIPQP